MGYLRSIPLNVVSKLFFMFSLCQAIQLEEIRPWNSRAMAPRSLGKRDMSVFELKSTETFLWGARDGTDAMLGNLTVFMPGDNENILSMEKFKGMLNSVKCDRHGMTLAFEDDSSFAYAQRTWDWVNGADNHTFVMVAGQGDCGNNTRRLPYLVSTIAYDEDQNTARLNATSGSWTDLLHSYELRVGSVPMSSDLGLAKREWSTETSLDMSANLNFKKEVKIGSMYGEIVCDPCKTTGKMKFELVLEVRWNAQVNLQFRVAPQGVTAIANLDLKVGSELISEPKTFKESMLKIPLSPISIAGGDILTVGPILEISCGFEISAIKGSVAAGFGATATLPDTAVLQADMLDPSKNKFSSWVPRIVKDDFTLDAQLSFSLQMFLEPAIKLQAEALGNGLEAGLELKFPYVEAEVEASTALGGGACKPGDSYQGALKLTPQAGIAASFTAGKIKGDKDVDITLGSAPFKLGSPLCFGFAEKKPGSTPGSKSGTATQPSTGGSNPTPVGGQSGKPCTVKTTGKTGTCIAIASCSGTSTPGFCPDDPDNVQCCTVSSSPPPPPKKESDSNICSIGSKGPSAGECISKNSCSSLKGKSTPGHCPDTPDDIQCCTYDGCKTSKGQSGECIPTQACKGKSTPGLCNGGDNIQCCTT